MKNLITFLLSCLSLTALIGQAANETRITLLSKSQTETTLRLSATGVDQHAVTTPQGEAFTISIPEGTPLLEAGQPDLPKIATPLLIPGSGNMAVEILAGEYQDFFNISVAPSRGNLKRDIDPASVPFTYGSVYEQDAFFPGKLADLKQPFVLRDARGQALWIYPVQYNPVSKVLRVYTSITLRVYHTGGQGENELMPGMHRGESAAFEQIYRKIFLNYTPKVQSRSDLTPDKMLVITKQEFLTDLEPLLTWKRQSGIHTEVVTVEEIGSSQSSAIYNFVKSYYQTEGITYLLLAGDEEIIEPEMRADGNLYSCDNCFGYLDGNDHFSDILVGRFHAATAEQLRIMVNRNLDYEKTPLADPVQNWCATGMAVTSNEGQGIGDDNQADYDQGNEWKSKHLANGFEKYWEFYDGDHSAISPTPGDETADKAGNPASAELVGLMNGRGLSLFNYTGHGWDQGLASGNFDVTSAAALRNTHRYPILIGVGCSAGNFTAGVCLGEALQRAGDDATGKSWGSITSFLSSDLQSWAPPMEGQDGMNQYLADADGITLRPSMAGMMAYGNTLMIAAYDDGGELMADFWNTFGEPSAMPRTKLPATLTATHPAGAFLGASNLTVNSDVEGALVSLYWQEQTLAVSIVENGAATLEFPPLNDVGVLTVTVSQFNYTPYQGDIQVVPDGIAFVVNQSIAIDDAAGNGNQKADFGEALKLDLTLANVGVLPANATSATLSTADDQVVITDGTEDFGDLGAGASSEINAAFAFTVGDAVKDGHIVYFDLHIEYDGGSYDASLAVPVYAPELAISTFKLDDTQGGNGNGKLESGETVKITVSNLNTGHSDSPAALGILSTDSPWLTLTDMVPLGQINALSGAKDAVFYVSVAPDAPNVVSANFHYQLMAGSYTRESDFGPFIINKVIETFESQNFATFPWIMGGNKPWQTTSIAPYTGAYCARSGSISHNQKSVMELTVHVSAEGIISFARKVNCETDFDFLRFSIDDVEMERWSGNKPWKEVSYPVSPGFHKFTWSYEKDGIGTSGQDRAWIDEISLPPHEIVVSAATPENNSFQISVTPNPTSGTTWISMELYENQPVSINIFDLAGRRVQEEASVNWPAGHTIRPLDLSSLSPGVYLVEVRTPAGKQVEKVVRQ